jgi:hypothetical protein
LINLECRAPGLPHLVKKQGYMGKLISAPMPGSRKPYEISHPFPAKLPRPRGYPEPLKALIKPLQEHIIQLFVIPHTQPPKNLVWLIE